MVNIKEMGCVFYCFCTPQVCLPSALRSLILQKKPNTRNMSSMSRPPSLVVPPRPLALASEKFC
ncbi:D-glutamate cyclase, mitochondrial [Ovis aries]|uniref:D-glutamate cyclase, mitochondrial n=1 Tax=Ovis aries TaxID=9940 RepID=UPI001C2E4AAA|nr:D-glutamate cyclase, mitochondrial [Ovis aries]